MAVTFTLLARFVQRFPHATKVAVNPADLVSLTAAAPSTAFTSQHGRLQTPVTPFPPHLPPLSVTIEADPTVAVNDIQIR